MGRPGVLQSMGLQRVRHKQVTEQENKFCSRELNTSQSTSQRPHLLILSYLRLGFQYTNLLQLGRGSGEGHYLNHGNYF